MEFYREYYNYSRKKASDFKIVYLKSFIEKNKIYKFIAFDDNEKSNLRKLECLRRDMLWFSHYIYLNDKTEFEIKYDSKKVSRETGIREENIKFMVETMKEIYDVCSFSYKKEEYMWEAYANHKNGICIVFNVENYDMLYPVEYFNKDEIDYTSILINDYSRPKQELLENGSPMAELPFVTKNPMNGDMKSYEEKEVRILKEPYEDSSFNNGVVRPYIKEDLGYKGQNISYTDCGLSVSRVIIGVNCNEKIANEIITDCNQKGYMVEKTTN
ncbi:MAG: hypothetical protein UDG86_00190 [Lachnospiraceae bacterium]|nr:hypothetical protein [Lachnospiraceae bacterium]